MKFLSEIMKKMKIPEYIFLAIAASCVILFSIYLVPAANSAKELGTGVGGTAGKVVGTAVGTYDAFIGGEGDYWQGRENGKAEGLSAKDTEAKLNSIIVGTGKLQVLVVGLTLDDMHGDSDKYKALYILTGEAIYTVDLGAAQIDVEHQVIRVPRPEGRLIIDESRTEKLAEYQKKGFLSIGDGSTEEGITAYINSIAQLKKEGEEKIRTDPNLLERAKTAAVNQIGELTRQITGNAYTVEFII